ncbi:Gfo/Idh/MocA family oxidoreductase [Luteolibacter sp. GHJ8]|uniref:Gfo/Idh/MocA family oxidoreductase n=1 Tax=Luteolibacter rhizosphaerae TaxID=2989719 RepID=A0ABT3G035_9BACT|nr:Gfo/Idh/MocA family oxidoreductase [Luteolibacter rhizosphaerae]MCW1913188.1 Gfo/Idh/MocA family oxidoreductase [Luteolibacter rhizosphaerae]
MNSPSLSRRHVLAGSVVTAAVAGFPNLLLGQGANTQKLKIGLIGCGGRGTGAAEQALNADPNVVLWAVGDAFPEAITGSLNGLKGFGAKVDVGDRKFAGLDAYQKVIESGVDVVLLGAPPGFRPQHLRAAVEAGKHVFAEKPMAIDVAGVKSVLESAKLAKEKGVAIQHGYCWRFAPGVRELYSKITSGELGKVYSIYGTYMGSPPKPLQPGMKKPDGMGDVEWQLRWWTNFEWTSGGPLLEQAIHTVDKIAWAMGDVAPIAAVANGGRAYRTDAGNVYDHYNIAYEYPGGVIAHLGERQYLGCHTEVIDRIYCEKGTAIAPNTPMVMGLDGKKREWMYRAPAGMEQNMYQVCHNEFFAALRKGEIINTGEYMANSTMLGILGREAAHTGQRITWDALWASNQDQAPDTLQMGDAFAVTPVPVPGVHKVA